MHVCMTIRNVLLYSASFGEAQGASKPSKQVESTKEPVALFMALMEATMNLRFRIAFTTR